MKIKSLIIFCIACLLLSGFSRQQKIESADIVIVGGSSGAVGAAIGAARSGASVILIEDTPVLGGMLSNGISNIDCYSYESLSGVFDEFRIKVKEYYQPIMDKDPIFKFRLSKPKHSFTEEEKKTRTSNTAEPRARQTNEAVQGGRWEPHVADKILKKMVAAYPNIRIYYNRHATGVLKDKNRLIGVKTTTEDNKEITFMGKVIIDATHEADIAAWAGAPYRVGREARSKEEPHAGEIYYYNSTGEIIPKGSGKQDFAIPSYGIRLCIKYYDPEKGDKHILKNPPANYNPVNYEYALYDKGPFEASMPSMKVEMNKNPVGNELQEVNWSWPESTYEQRKEIYQFYKNHALGFLYYLHHERGIRNIGLPDDEFKDNENIPYRVFAREARRIEGEVVLNETDINPFVNPNSSLTTPFQQESVAIGHYPIDAKPVRQKTDISTPDKGEGDFFLSNTISPFQIPYKALLPKNVEGLIVPVAISATHVAFSAIRMDATWMSMGQAAGIAAGLSVKKGIPVRDISVSDLQNELLEQKCKLVFYWDVPLNHPSFKAIQQASLRKWIDQDFSREFFPDSLLTRGEAAKLVKNAFDIWPSVSTVHFSDVGIRHPQFQAIETLFDNGLLEPLGVKPRWPEAGGYASKNDGFDSRKSNFGQFFPDKAISQGEFTALLGKIRDKKGSANDKNHAKKQTSKGNPTEFITRAAAVEILWKSINE